MRQIKLRSPTHATATHRQACGHCTTLACRTAYANKPVLASKRKLESGHFSQSKCISPERPGRRLIEKIEFSFCLERAYGAEQQDTPPPHTVGLLTSKC
jgi:hypothetical protein